MTTLLELREKTIRFFSKNEIFIVPVVKFLIAFLALMLIKSNMGYMTSISKTPIALILALICAVLPVNIMIFIFGVVMLADFYALSLAVCVVALVIFLLVYLIYFRFAPQNQYGVVLMPLLLQLKIPYILPIGMGLLREVYAVFSVICGAIVYFFIDGVKENAAVLGETTEKGDDIISKFTAVLNQFLGNKEMYLVIAIMAITMIIVYIIRRLSIEHAWVVAIIAGTLFQTIGMVAGYLLLGIPGKILGVILANVLACAVGFVIQFLFLNLDYTRTERVQFEDDDYYYYVKAIPKSIVTESKKQVKHFNGKSNHEKKDGITKKQFAEEMDIDETLLD